MGRFFKSLWKALIFNRAVQHEIIHFEWGDFFYLLIIAAIDALFAGVIAAIIARIINKDPETWFMRAAAVVMCLNIVIGVIVIIC